MHGRPRKPAKPEDTSASIAKAEKLRALQSQFLSNHHNKEYTKEAMELSAKLLEINPESYTAWNYRKLAVEHTLAHCNSDPDSVKSIFDEELRVVENALRQNFKSYGAWHHRKWVLSKGHSSIEKELKLLEKLQKADPRNFHAWNYRRFVAALMNRSDEDELNYAQDLIDINFSNYSAWHNRSVLLSNLMKKRVPEYTQKEAVLTKEFDLVREALFTDEDDQSGWFYHLWLLDQTVKAQPPRLVSTWPAHGSNLFLFGDEHGDDFAASPMTTYYCESGTFSLVLYFNQAVEGVSSSTIKVASSLKTSNLVWETLTKSNPRAARVWVTKISLVDADHLSMEPYVVKVTIGHSEGIVSSNGTQYGNPSHFEFKVHVRPAKTERTGESLLSWKDEEFHIYESHSLEPNLVDSIHKLCIENGNGSKTFLWQSEIIAEEIKNFRDLSDCKIGKLTLARLLDAHDALNFSNKPIHSEEILQLYVDLMKLDPSHSGYYRDEHSLILLKQLTSNRESLLTRCFHSRSLTSSCSGGPVCLRINKLSLTRMGSFENLLWVQMLDLSYNELQSIEGLEAMHLLSCLNLSRNKLCSFTTLEPLKHLKSLKVLDVSYNEIGAHSIDTTRYLCASPLSHSDESELDGENILTTYWEAYFALKGINLIQLDVLGNPIVEEQFSSFLVKILPTLQWLDGIRLSH